MQKVWYRKSKHAWFATLRIGGKQQQIRLVTAPNDRDGRKKAEDHSSSPSWSPAGIRRKPRPTPRPLRPGPPSGTS